MIVLPATAAHVEGLVALFERTGSPCFCRWWHFDGDRNAWLDRCANRSRESRDELVAALGGGRDDARGVVALEGGAVIGWMKLAPAPTVPKLFEQRPYRGLPVLAGHRPDVWVVGCFLVDEPWRRRGVAAALLDAGLAHARRCGATAVEAFPRRVAGVPPEQLWTGPIELFERRGFRVVTELCPCPVLRRDLS